MIRIKLFEQFNKDSNIEFKDINGKIAAVGDFITFSLNDENKDEKTVGKVKRIFNDGTRFKEDRMEVDIRSQYLELNRTSEFEIIEDKDKKLEKAFK